MIKSGLAEKIRERLSRSDFGRLIGILEEFHSDHLEDPYQLIEADCIVGYSTIVVILTFSDASNSVKRFVLKMAQSTPGWGDWAKSRIGYEFDSTKLVYDAFSKNGRNQVVQPVCFYPNQYAIVFGYFDGSSADKLIGSAMKLVSGKKFEGRANQVCEQAGAWLKTFQTLCPPQEHKTLSSDHVQNKLNSLFSRIPQRFHGDFVNVDREKIERSAHYYFERFDINDKQGVLKHNDFAPWNVLYSSSEIRIIDFADLELDTRFYDYFYYIRSIDLIQSKLGNMRSCATTLKDAFIRGYGEKPATDNPIIQFYEIVLNLERIKMLLNAIEHPARKPMDMARHIKYKKQLRYFKNCLSRHIL